MVTRIGVVFVSALVLLAVPAPAGAAPVLVEDFEGDPDEVWTYFEELVAGNQCAADGIGSAGRTDAGQALSGDWSMRVSTNSSGQVNATNHVIGQNRLLDIGVEGEWVYRLWFYADPTAMNDAQSAPEFSLQNTHPIGVDAYSSTSIWRTHTAGIQYIPQHDEWRIWADDGAGPEPDSELATWHVLDDPNLPLGFLNGWYSLELTVDYDNNHYGTLTIDSENGFDPGGPYVIDLSTWDIAREVKWYEGALWATLEAENLYTCGHQGVSAYSYDAYYDDVEVEQTMGAIPTAPTPPDPPLVHSMYATESVEFTLEDLADDLDDDLDPGTLLITVDSTKGVTAVDLVAGTITYTAEEPGGDAFKYAICDAAYYCTEAWVSISSPNRPPVGSTIYETVSAGASINFDNPVVDPDGNLDPGTRGLTPGFDPPGTLAQDGGDGFTYTAPAEQGEVAFNVTTQDDWGWAGYAWVVITVE